MDCRGRAMTFAEDLVVDDGSFEVTEDFQLSDDRARFLQLLPLVSNGFGPKKNGLLRIDKAEFAVLGGNDRRWSSAIRNQTILGTGDVHQADAFPGCDYGLVAVVVALGFEVSSVVLQFVEWADGAHVVSDVR